MPDYTSWEQLFQKMRMAGKDAVEEIAIEVWKELEKYVERKVYSAYTPKVYERTREFINSIDVNQIKVYKDGYIEVDVFYNPEKINPIPTGSYWNKHMSIDGETVWNGIPLPELIPMIIEYGTSGSLWDRDGIDSVETISNKIMNSNKHIKIFKRIFRKHGFVVE